MLKHASCYAASVMNTQLHHMQLAHSKCLAIPNVRRTTKTADLAYVPHCVQSVSDAVAIENGTSKNLLDRLCNEDADHAPNLPYPPTNDSTLTLEVFVDNLKLWRLHTNLTNPSIRLVEFFSPKGPRDLHLGAPGTAG